MAGLIPLKFGVANDLGAPQVRFGIEKGFFAEEGVDLSIHRVYGGPELAREFAENRVMIGEFGSPPALTAIAKGCPIKIIASGTRKKFMMTLAVRKEITDWPQLKGAKVALLSPGSCTEWVAREMWLKHGLDPEKDIEFVVLREDHSNMVGEIKSGRFDAYLATEPQLAHGEISGAVTAWARGYDPEYLPNFQWGVMVARPDFIEREPELVRKVLRIAQKSANYGKAHVREWAESMAAQQGLPVEAPLLALSRDMPLFELDGQIDVPALRETIAVLRRLGAFTQDLKVEEICDLRFQPTKMAA